MIQIAKNEVWGHFLEFGISSRLDTAYLDSTKWCQQFGNDITHILHKLTMHNQHNLCKKQPKTGSDTFLRSDWSDCSDIAYVDSTKWSS